MTPTPTQKKHIRQWVAALRSGKYKQGQHKLNPSKGRYCCLGVAAVVAGKEIPGHAATLKDVKSMKTWLGIVTPGGDVLISDSPYGMSGIMANDEERWSFKRIADAVVERYLTPARKKRTRA